MPAARVLKHNRSWLLLAVLIFTAGGIYSCYTGITSGGGAPLAGAGLEELQVLFDLILGSNPVIAVMLLFMFNFITLAQMILLGVFAGVSPLFTLFLNGRMLGTLAIAAAGEGLPLLPLFFLGILPHGIFELPAFFICGAMGLKFGYHCVAFPLPGKTRLQSLKYIWKETISVLPPAVLLLLAAALVEVMVTPRLLGLVMDVPF